MEATITRDTKTKFAEEVIEGLSAYPKFLSSKHLYDERGNRLFQAITQMPEYYLTDSEFEIISTWKNELLKTFAEPTGDFILIGLGAGDGIKTNVLLKHLVNYQVKFSYFPVDISTHALEHLLDDLSLKIPGIKAEGILGDFLPALEQVSLQQKRKVILFLGSGIGNFENDEAIVFLSKIAKQLDQDDLLLIGFDLIKDPSVILDAYNDKQGITRAFNFNMLERINKELGGNFDISKFKHFPTYDPNSAEARSYIISKEKQEVYLKAADKHILFNQWEAIHTEVSKKFDIASIEKLAMDSGFNIKYNFYDYRHYFVDSVWCLK